MTSAAASALWTAFRDGPKQIEMELDQRREAGEHAEDITTEPEGVVVTDAPDVDGLWIVPHEASDGAAVLYLFGGGYVLGSPHSRWKTAGHVANASHARVLVPNYRLAPEHKFPAAVEDAVAAYRFLCSAGAEPDRGRTMGSVRSRAARQSARCPGHRRHRCGRGRR